jgi:hypothetical protein
MITGRCIKGLGELKAGWQQKRRISKGISEGGCRMESNEWLRLVTRHTAPWERASVGGESVFGMDEAGDFRTRCQKQVREILKLE